MIPKFFILYPNTYLEVHEMGLEMQNMEVSPRINRLKNETGVTLASLSTLASSL